VPGKPGEVQIDEDEAAVVHEIFESYVGGKTPREIAARLNGRKVPPPRGRYWTDSTLNGSLKRHNGMILNDLYADRWQRECSSHRGRRTRQLACRRSRNLRILDPSAEPCIPCWN
jgi:Recombinase